jgi:predicted AlkP superfamily phosphohydrolase/phosphomutase
VVSTSPLVLFGIDAGDPELLTRWSRAGDLPNLARIMERGSWGTTGGAEMVSEHGVWVSIFSGISRRDHGYFYFRQMAPGTYDLQAVTGLDIDAPPFWVQDRPKGRRATVIDIPDYDVVPGLAGTQLCHWATHNNWDPDHFVTSAEPAEVLDEVARRFVPRMVTVENRDATVGDDLAILDELLTRVARKGAACRYLLARDPWDLFATVFAESHTANHQFWRYRPGLRGGASDHPRLSDGTREVYRAVDRELGLVLDALPPDARVFVVSSVGMEDDFPITGLIETFCRRFGYQASPESSSSRPRRRPIDLVRRLVPERWRLALSRRLSREARERLLADRFRVATDWTNTRAFALPSAYTGFVRVNLRGREPEGVVAPGAEYAAVLDRLEADLATLVDPVSGAPAVKRSTRTIDAFGCPPHPTLPDLWVDWLPGRFLDRVAFPGGELTQERPDFFRRSDHSDRGFFAAAGPGIAARGEIGAVDVLDLAPTFQALLGRPPTARMTGAPIRSFLA